MNIAQSCCLLDPDMHIIKLTGSRAVHQLWRAKEDLTDLEGMGGETGVDHAFSPFSSRRMNLHSGRTHATPLSTPGATPASHRSIGVSPAASSTAQTPIQSGLSEMATLPPHISQVQHGGQIQHGGQLLHSGQPLLVPPSPSPGPTHHGSPQVYHGPQNLQYSNLPRISERNSEISPLLGKIQQEIDMQSAAVSPVPSRVGSATTTPAISHRQFKDAPPPPSPAAQKVNSFLLEDSAKPTQHLNSRVGLVIDGDAVTQIVNDPQGQKWFYEVAVRCHSCVACRLSPMQKRQIVELVRKYAPRSVTAAIGSRKLEI